MSVGPWKPITLQTFSAAIGDLRASAVVSPSLNASLSVGVDLKGTITDLTVSFKISDLAGRVIKQETHPVKHDSSCRLHWTLDRKEVELWWPVGYGKQVLYDVEVSLLNYVSTS
jgi:beta-mannosidase